MAVNLAYAPSTAFTFSNSNLIVAVPWPALSADHIKVYHLVDGEMTPADESKYEVRGNKIHLSENIFAEGESFYVRREVPLLQPYDSTGVSAVRPKDLERALDTVIMAAQEIKARELFEQVVIDQQSIGYIAQQQGWRLGKDGDADVSGFFHGTANITDGVIDGRTVEIIGVTSTRQHMMGFADANLGAVETPSIDGVSVHGAGRTIIVTVFITKLFGGIRRFDIQISKDASTWWSLPDNPDPDVPDSWRGTGGGFTSVEGVQESIGPLPYEEVEGSPIPTTYYVRVRGVRVDDYSTGWTGAQQVILQPTGKKDIVAGAISAEVISVDKLSTLSANMGVLTAGEIRSPDGQMLIDLSSNSVNFGDSAHRGMTGEMGEINFNGVVRADYIAPSGRDWDGGDAESAYTDMELSGGTAETFTNFYNLSADDRTGHHTGPEFHSVVIDSSLYIAEKAQIGDYRNDEGILWDGETLDIKGHISGSTISGSTISGGTVTGVTIDGVNITGSYIEGGEGITFTGGAGTFSLSPSVSATFEVETTPGSHSGNEQNHFRDFLFDIRAELNTELDLGNGTLWFSGTTVNQLLYDHNNTEAYLDCTTVLYDNIDSWRTQVFNHLSTNDGIRLYLRRNGGAEELVYETSGGGVGSPALNYYCGQLLGTVPAGLSWQVTGLPESAAGLPSGQVYKDANGFLKIT